MSKYIIHGLMVCINFGIVFELFVYEIYGDSDGAFLCGTEILNSKLNEMDFIRNRKKVIFDNTSNA